ncbi:MAG: 1-deoxy-D-xylulose-5-phosphate synthase [Gammaproteobacteria bacterium]|nr:1-deoxy-D-xylulose-5-phosphate synthase [Gammaproteobacteria bacterium]
MTETPDKTDATNSYPLLFAIDSPDDLRRLEKKQLPELADEIRRFLIEVTSRTGGHLAPGLGAVELTLALHYVFDTPRDRLVWDIGHQAYPHKLLTGRRGRFHTIRQSGGLSGFLKRSESEFDAFGAGHASTSLSAALGMAVAARLDGAGNEVVAVIGDGALTGGIAYEALNNAGDLDANLLVVLNDNEMSISRNVGAISNYLARILSGRAYTSVREGSKTVLSTLPPPVKNLARRWEEHMKGMVMPGTLFEELGFYYIGPIDGHNLNALIRTLKNMRGLSGPRFLHVVTQKGKGFTPAMRDPCVYHGVTPFNPSTGKLQKKSGTRTYTHVFGDWLCDQAARDEKLVGITPAMREGSGLVRFSQDFPERYFDVGIAEQHSLTFAAGLAAEGFKPVVAIYSTFLQRAYDQMIHDIAIQNLDVTFAIDRAGLVGADGETHAGSYDYAYLRCVPGLVVMAPADEAECRDMLFTAYRHPGPASVRYPRGGGPGVAERAEMRALPIGKGEVRRAGRGVAILAFGAALAAAEEVGRKLGATVANMRFVKPLDEELILELAATHDLLVSVEEHVVAGGAGSGVSEALRAHGVAAEMLHLGLPDEHIPHGAQDEQRAACGLDARGIERAIARKLSQMRPRRAS